MATSDTTGVAPATAGEPKVFADAEAALTGLLRDGLVILVGGFGLIGNPEHAIAALARSRVRDLTIISNNCGSHGKGMAILLKQRQVRRVICSYMGGNPDLAEQYAAGQVEIELNPQGTLAERIRAGGAGIGGFFTPTGAGTVVAQGKETRLIDGRPHVFETPLRGDLALVRAAIGDPDGNLRFYRTARNFNPLVATAGRVTVAEVDRLVGRGDLDPDDVHLPGVFVHRIFAAAAHDDAPDQITTRIRP